MPIRPTRRALAGLLLVAAAGCGTADQSARSQSALTASPPAPTRRAQAGRPPGTTPRPTRTPRPTFTPTATATPVPANPAINPGLPPTFTPIPTPALDAVQQQVIGYWQYVDPESKRGASFVFSPNGSTGWFMTHESGALGTFRFTGPDQLETDMADIDLEYEIMAWTVAFSADGNQLTISSNTGETAPFQLTRITDPSMPWPPEGFPGYGRPAPTPTPAVVAPPPPAAVTLEPYAEPAGLFQVGVAPGWQLAPPLVRSNPGGAGERWLEYVWAPAQTRELSKQFVFVVNAQDGLDHRQAMRTLLDAYYADYDYRITKNGDMAGLQYRAIVFTGPDGTEIQADLSGSLEPPYFVVHGYQMPTTGDREAAKDFGSQMIRSFSFDPTVKMAELGIR